MHHAPAWPSSPTAQASRVEPDPSDAADIMIPHAGTLNFEPMPRKFLSGEVREGPVTRADGVTRDVLFYKRYEFRFPPESFYEIALVARGFEAF